MGNEQLNRQYEAMLSTFGIADTIIAIIEKQ